MARLAERRHPLLVGVVQHLLQEVRVDGVEHAEEVLAGRALILGQDVREVRRHLFVLLELRPDVLGGQLVVVRHFNVGHLLLAEQLLLALEDGLEEVLVDVADGRQVVLYWKGIRKKEWADLRCLSRYWMKSALDLSFQLSSVACMKPSDRFLLSVI